MIRWVNALPLLAACAALVASTPVPPQQARFRSTADAVQVDVQVTARGRPVAGLTAADFELRDSGVRQQIQSIAFEDVPISLLLALDVSSSVKGEALEHLKQAARAAIVALRPGDQAALLAFPERVMLKSDWTSDRAVLERAISGLQAQGATALHDAIFTAVALREHAAGRTVLLAFTDGADTTSWLDPHTVIKAAQRSDLVVTAVSSAPRLAARSGDDSGRVITHLAALRRWFDSDPTLFPNAFLDKLTEETGGELLYTSSNRDLARVFEKIVADFKTRYLLTYAPKGVPDSGWHPINVKLKARSGEVKARRGYWRQGS